jgi:hypothetical protein
MPIKSSIIATTISTAFALVMITSVAPAQPVEITNARVEAPPVISIPSDARAAKWVKFQSLVKDWRNQRGISSSVSDMSMTAAYQNIIGMGEDAIPLIVAQMKSEGDDPDQWFWALKAIAQVDPVRPNDRGDFAAMAQAWIKWAEDEGYAG